MNKECISIPIGSHDISKKLKQLIKINNSDLKEEQLKEDYIIDLKISSSNVNPRGEMQVLQFDKLKLKFSDSWILFEGYFGDF